MANELPRDLTKELSQADNLWEMFKILDKNYKLDKPLNGLDKKLAAEYLSQYVPIIVNVLTIPNR